MATAAERETPDMQCTGSAGEPPSDRIGGRGSRTKALAAAVDRRRTKLDALGQHADQVWQHPPGR